MTEHLVFFVEGLSERDFLEGLLPKIVPPHVTAHFQVFQGKQDLEKQLVRRMKFWLMPNTRFLVMRDQDSGDCKVIKATLQRLCVEAGHPNAVVRIACRELDTFFAGDWPAIASAFDKPNVADLGRRAKFRDPDLSQVSKLAKIFDVSKEAAARSYAQYHDLPVATVVTKNGVIDRIYRNITRFPKLVVGKGSPVPPSSIMFRTPRQTDHPTDLVDAYSEYWLESEWGTKLPTLYEQVAFQQGPFALMMLWADVREPEEKDDERTAKERYRDEQEKWNRQ